jgi:hypothetical protein
MVLHFDRESLHARVERRTFRHRHERNTPPSSSRRS